MKEKEVIYLGKTEENSPSIAAEPSDKKSEPKEYFPTVYISDIEELDDLPMEGEATIRYKLVSKTERKSTDSKGEEKESCSVEMEIQSITPVKSIEDADEAQDEHKLRKALGLTEDDDLEQLTKLIESETEKD